MKDLLYIVIGIVAGAWIYSKYFSKKPQSLPDTSVYENRIDSLQKAIIADKAKLTTYDSIATAQETKIARLNKKLQDIADEAAQQQKQHEEDIQRIGAMSNNDIASTFAESFK
jgi:hypothetical protein